MDTEADQQQLLRTASGADTRSVSADPIKRYHSTDPSGTESLRSYPVVVAIQDYVPAPGKDPEEALPLDQGQIVEVLDNKNAAGWLVRTKARPPQTGWVPGSYFETPSKYYTQRRTTRELMGDDAKLDERQQALLKREQVFADLLRTEEDFAAALREAMHYVEALESEEAPEEVKSHKPQLALQLEAMQNFHANVLLKGLQYYSDDPGKVGQTFVRLERDFEMHVSFLRELDTTIRMIQEVHAISQFLEEVKSKSETALRPYTEYLQLVPERVAKYEDFFKEIIKYSTRAQQNTDIMQKALELVQSMPKRAKEIEFTKNILNYPGDTRQLGRIYRHELFQVWEGDGEASEKYVFLFKNKMMLTDRDMRPDPPLFRHYSTIRVDKYTVRQHTTEDETIVFQPNEPGLPSFRMKAKDFESQEFVRKAWLKDISEMQAAIGGSGDKEEEADGQVHQEGATAGGEE